MSLVLGPVLRHVGETTASVWVQLDQAATVSVLGCDAPTFEVCGHHYAIVAVTGLEPDTRYPYQVHVDGEQVWPPRISPYPQSLVHTRGPGSARRHRIIFGSCRYAKVVTPDSPATDMTSRALAVDSAGRAAVAILTVVAAAWAARSCEHSYLTGSCPRHGWAESGLMIAVAVPDRWDGHQLVLASAREGGDALAGWVERGLRLQEKMLYAAYGDHTSVDELVASLDAHGVDASAAAEDGRLEVVEPARLYRADGYTGLVDQARREGYSGVRTFVGPDPAAGAVDAADLEEFERVADRLWAARGVTSFCRYDPRLAAGRDRLADIIAAHASGWGDQMVHAYRGDAGELCLEGEVDLANDAVFAAIISVAAAKAERQLVVDCSALRFMSVSAWRTAVNATAPLRERGGRVLLSGVSPLEHHILNTTRFGEAFDEVSG